MNDKQDSVQHLLFQATHLYLSKNFTQVSKMGIHPGQIPMLGIVSENEGITQSEICKKLNIKPSTATVSLKRMEKNGMLRRAADERDQRVIRVYLTERGRETIRESKEIMTQNEKTMLEGLSEAEICLMKRMLRQIYSNLNRISGEDVSWCHCEGEENQEC
ncbi:MAG: MarR family transcriptional regulator [Clostridia bacterium]|nr:MarR family transcriptional regulator [Clostridia bacterium]NCC42627.1 MarR family transcriptional regulator [Clostridia bacterium]